MNAKQKRYRQSAKGKATMAASSKRWRQTPAGREAHARLNREKYQRRREFIRALKQNKPCLDCNGVFDIVCMDFDHRPGEIKLFEIGHEAHNHTEAKILAEVAKCDLVCSNCHRLRTFRERNHRAICIKEPTESPQLALIDSLGDPL